MKRYGLLGYPLSHSFSKNYFNEKFEDENLLDSEYIHLEYDNLDNIRNLISQQKALLGFNVTIPYKKAIVPYLDKIDERAQVVGAINTVQIKEGKWIGYNTDIIGFEKSLLNFLGRVKEENLLKSGLINVPPMAQIVAQSIRPSSKLKAELPFEFALILGNGGASQAVRYVLENWGLQTTIVTRNVSSNHLTYKELNEDIIKKNQLIVNCTPLGMFPNALGKPIVPYEYINDGHYVFDLIYNPSKTQFLESAQKGGAYIQNGLEMLHIQAEEAYKIWTENPIKALFK